MYVYFFGFGRSHWHMAFMNNIIQVLTNLNSKLKTMPKTIFEFSNEISIQFTSSIYLPHSMHKTCGTN